MCIRDSIVSQCFLVGDGRKYCSALFTLDVGVVLRDKLNVESHLIPKDPSEQLKMVNEKGHDLSDFTDDKEIYSEIDSAVTVSKYNMWSPLRARKVDEDGLLRPFVPLETFGDPATLNCDRDSQGDVHFADMAVSVVRPFCLEKLDKGLLPQKWMGKRIARIPNWGGCDVDYEWQIPMVEYWLRKHGFQEAEGQ